MAVIHHECLEVMHLDGLLVQLPIIRMGLGKPRLVLIAGLHGDEETSLVVLWTMYQYLLQNQVRRGEVVFLPVGNPPALAARRRVSHLDNQDLNRIFPALENQTVTERIAQTLLDFLAPADFAVDIHDLASLNSPSVGLIMATSDSEILLQSWRGLAAFAPEAAWEITYYYRNDLRSKLPLCAALSSAQVLSRRVPNFALEVPHHTKLCKEEMQNLVIGLHNLISHLGFGLSPLPLPHQTTVYRHSKVVADDYGLFVPLQVPITSLRVGETVGSLVRLSTLESRPILMPQDGLLIQVGTAGMVAPGQPLIRTAEIDEDLTNRLRAWQQGWVK